MQDEFNFSDQKFKNNVPRARLFLRAQLAWLWGYPLVNQPNANWQQLYFPMPWDTQQFTLTFEHLAKGSYSANRIINSFPKALPDVLGDVIVWKQRVNRKLQTLRTLLEQKPDFDPWQELIAPEGNARFMRRVQSLKHTTPTLTPLLDAFAWWLSLQPDTLEQACNWIETESTALQTLIACPEGIQLAASLFVLSQTLTTAKTSKVLALVSHTVWANPLLKFDFHARYDTVIEHACAKNTRTAFLELPEPVPDADYQGLDTHYWLKTLTDLLQLPSKEQKRRLDVLLTLCTPTLLNCWENWLQEYELLLADYQVERANYINAQRNAVSPRLLKTMNSQYLEPFYKHWQVLANPKSVWLNPQLLARLVDYYAERPNALKWLQTLSELLETLKSSDWNQADTLLMFAWHWERIHNQCDTPTKLNRWTKTISAWLNYLKAATNSTQLKQFLAPWRGLHHYYYQNTYWHFYRVETLVITNEIPNDFNIELFFQNLAGLSAQRYQSYESMYEFYYFWINTPKHWNRLAYISLLQQRELTIDLSSDNYKLLDILLGEDQSPEHFLKILEQWQLANQHTQTNTQRQALKTAAWLIQQGYSELVNVVVEHERWELLASLDYLVQTFEKLKQPLSPLTRFNHPWPEDFQRYPATLKPALEFVLIYHPHPVAAQRVLDEQFRSPESLQQEISVLQQRLAASPELNRPLSKRLEQLHSYLIHPPKVSEVRIEHLKSRLYQAATQASLEHCQQNGVQVLEQALAKALYLETFDSSWLQDKAQRHALMGLCALDTVERQLAGQLLSRHSAHQSYRLTEAPANQAWLKRMSAQGLDLSAWLDDLALVAIAQVDNETAIPLHFQWAKTIFDVFQMGDHFETCLSHDSFNFFSVLANAVDLNKRVLYGLDNAGKVQVRCLLAISDAGHLVHFNLYSHLPQATVAPCMEQVLSYLEQAMRIERYNTGTVSCLVAKHWYDDGIDTLNVAQSVLDNKGTFYKSLKTLPAEQVLTAYRKVLEPRPLTEQALTQLIGLNVFKDQPATLITIWQQLIGLDLITPTLERELLRQLIAAPELYDAVWPLCRDWLADYLHNYIMTGYHFPESLELLLQYQPLKLLKLLRLTQHRIKHHFYSYWQDSAQFYKAKALLAVKRPRQALDELQDLRSRNFYVSQSYFNACNELLQTNAINVD